MSKIILLSKIVPLFLITSIFFTACDVPDISKFTEQSAEMTRGIRKGVKDTENLIKTASEKTDLYSPAVIEGLKNDLGRYKKAVKPTLDTLASLDGYLGALNALAQANKKSEENSKAIVNSVSGLVTAVSGITLGDSAVNLAVGLVSLAEQFRTARDFKKRVKLAAEIVEGQRSEIINMQTGKTIVIKPCTREAINSILDSDRSKEQKEALIAKKGCGVIDLLKFNIEDLKGINEDISQSIFDNFADKNGGITDYHDAVNKSDSRVTRELANIHAYRNLVEDIQEAINTEEPGSAILEQKRALKDTLDSIFISDVTLKTGIIQIIETCGSAACGKIPELVQFSTAREGCNVRCKSTDRNCINKRDSCRRKRDRFFTDTTDAQFDNANSLIITALNKKEAELITRNKTNLADLQRIEASYTEINAELKSIKDRKEQLNQVLDTSLTALDTWAETHANLRVALETKQTISAAKLTSIVKELWDLLMPKPAAKSAS